MGLHNFSLSLQAIIVSFIIITINGQLYVKNSMNQLL